MDKFTYFRTAMLAGAYRSKAWVISAFSVVTGQIAQQAQNVAKSALERKIDMLRVRRDERGYPYFLDPDSGAQVYIEGALAKEPVFSFAETVDLKPGDVENLFEPVKSNYGVWLYNNIVVVYPFGNRIPFASRGYTIRELEKIIESRMQDNPEPDAEPSDLPPLQQPLYVDDYIRYNEAAGSLTGYTQLCVPAATRFTLTIDPAIVKRRDELLLQYKDQLHDQVIQARITDELIAMDRAWVAQDPDRGFYYTDKSYDVVRKKLFLFQGSEMGFEEKGEFIPTSLDEGQRVQDIPDLANAQRFGSFSRGSQTALGGVATKFNLRMFQNAEVVDGDCGSRIGKPVFLAADNFADYVGSYLVINGKPVVIKTEDQNTLVDREHDIRSPLFCLADGANFCSVCVGDKIATTKDAVATYAGEVGSMFMLMMMGMMHGKALKVAEYDFDRSLT